MDSNGSAISNQAFQEALQRARQLAAKISREAPGSGGPPSGGGGGGGGNGGGPPGGGMSSSKRPHDDGGGRGSPDAKRMAAFNDRKYCLN
ncbi:unnamed protein product [Oppiella nova]|uniref:Uncharacterized protein n=1 Tax=Oppiella nova TaxID=334625 RepID=A0A7R9MK38_9ACAR|nr:unnamed protein product [Oppiella nova]CAG2178762.1 unnamed protein product [Oppiella nova]